MFKSETWKPKPLKYDADSEMPGIFLLPDVLILPPAELLLLAAKEIGFTVRVGARRENVGRYWLQLTLPLIGGRLQVSPAL